MPAKKLFRFAVGIFLACPAFAEPARPVAEILPAFETIARQLFEETGVPGMSVAVVYRDEVVYLKGPSLSTRIPSFKWLPVLSPLPALPWQPSLAREFFDGMTRCRSICRISS